jgi:hypothetical protein
VPASGSGRHSGVETTPGGNSSRPSKKRAVNQSNIHIFLHEVGHTFGLDDFYDRSPNVEGFLMNAGSATQITEFAKWMFRDWWRHVRYRYGY